MTQDRKISTTKILAGVECDDNENVNVYLDLARNNILQRLYPFGHSGAALPLEYELMQCELAARYLIRRGMEAEISHSENGISRSFASVNDEDILCRVVPFAKVGGN